MDSYDVIVIGGGLLGCFAARNLRRWALNTALLEAREDVCTGISRANTAIIYPGYDHKPGTLKAGMTIRANAGFDRLCRELGVPFSRCGSLMLGHGPRAAAQLRKKYENGLAGAVPGLRLIGRDEALDMEPALSPALCLALFAPTAGTVNPWELGIGAFENAAANGVQARLGTRVLGLRSVPGGYVTETDKGESFCRAILNCTGLQADKLQSLLFPTAVKIVPSAGDYLVLDRATAGLPRHIIQYEPEDGGKGLSAVPTVEGSLLLGTSERPVGRAWATTAEGLRFIRRRAKEALPGLRPDHVIRSFAAVRPNPQRADGKPVGSFVIENPGPGFWSLIGIKTPGLTCANELGLSLAREAAAYLEARENGAFNPHREGCAKVSRLSYAQRKALVEENPDYGEIFCHCEGISKAEVLEAIRRGAVTLDGIKRRTGATMGRCQGSRCGQKLTELLARELGVAESTITKDGPGSTILGGGHGAL